MRREFVLDEGTTQAVGDYGKLKERLMEIRYAPLRAVQEAHADGVVLPPKTNQEIEDRVDRAQPEP